MMPRRLLGLRIALAFSGLLVAGGVALAQPVAVGLNPDKRKNALNYVVYFVGMGPL